MTKISSINQYFFKYSVFCFKISLVVWVLSSTYNQNKHIYSAQSYHSWLSKSSEPVISNWKPKHKESAERAEKRMWEFFDWFYFHFLLDCFFVYLFIAFNCWLSLRNHVFFNRRAYSALNPLTQEEKKQIVEAMSLSQGHWFKCPKGHVYAIGECGGAMERSRCNECGAVIGGANHRLEEGNDLAPEMDGARHAAWSEQANLQNYNLRDGLLWKVTTATV